MEENVYLQDFLLEAFDSNALNDGKLAAFCNRG